MWILSARRRRAKQQEEIEAEEEARRLEQKAEEEEAERRRIAAINEQQRFQHEELKKAREAKEREIKEQEIAGKAKAIIKAHAAILYRKKQQKIRRDDYGNTFDSDWRKEKDYFFNAVTMPQLKKYYRSDETEFFTPYLNDGFIEQALETYAHEHSADEIDIHSLNPIDFEAHCAALLNKAGWSTTMTRGSGDQGIDILGEINGLKAVFQVKKSSSLIGNKAVQEALAGKAFAGANIAFVVSNAGFTHSAQQLANASGVKLMHYSELSKIKIVRRAVFN